jgi:Glycosyl transferases group 1
MPQKIKIAIFSQPEYFRFMYENELDSFADTLEFKLVVGLKESDLASFIEYRADYNIFFRGEYLPDGVLQKLAGVKIALSSEPFPRLVDGKYEYTVDSILRYLTFRAIRNKPFDYVFHYDASSLPLFKLDRLYLSGQFAFPVATSIYRPVDRIKNWDLFFIGRSTNHRENHFGFLKHHYDFLHICHGVWGEPLVDYLSAAKICLNVHAENEVSWEPRMQMMLACGAFVISEKITPNSYLRSGIDYIEISSIADLHEKVAYYLVHEDERIKISENGRQRVLQLLNSRANFQQLIDDITAKKYPTFGSRRGNFFLDSIEAIGSMWAKIKRVLKLLINKV